jgi:hypothetical protein
MQSSGCASAVAVALILAGVTSAALAQHRERGDERRWHGDIHRFHERDIHRWRGGHWYHGHHGSRLGWWWIVGGVYYWYPSPIYPYPDPYTPPVVVVPPAAPQPPAPPPVAQAPASTWYYCDAAQAYYPYVAECPGGWRAVPATPPR